MKKFTDLILEKKSTKDVDFNQEMLQGLLKKYDEVDIITKDNQRYFITSFMHDKNGIIHDGNNVGFKALDKKGKHVEVMYSEIKGAEY
jgi:cystathionine beta-lyase family protein involved in aluminum resistance